MNRQQKHTPNLRSLSSIQTLILGFSICLGCQIGCSNAVFDNPLVEPSQAKIPDGLLGTWSFVEDGDEVKISFEKAKGDVPAGLMLLRDLTLDEEEAEEDLELDPIFDFDDEEEELDEPEDPDFGFGFVCKVGDHHILHIAAEKFPKKDADHGFVQNWDNNADYVYLMTPIRIDGDQLIIGPLLVDEEFIEASVKENKLKGTVKPKPEKRKRRGRTKKTSKPTTPNQAKPDAQPKEAAAQKPETETPPFDILITATSAELKKFVEDNFDKIFIEKDTIQKYQRVK